MENIKWYAHNMMSIDPVVYGTVTNDVYETDIVLVNVFSYLEEGEGTLVIRKKHYPLHAGDIFFIPYNVLTSHYVKKGTKWKIHWIGFNASFNVEHYIKDPVLHCPEGLTIFQSTMKYEPIAPSTNILLSARIFELLRLYLERDVLSQTYLSKQDQYVDYIKTVIHSNYSYPIRLSDIAAQLFVDTNYLCTVFRKKVGISPRQYLSAFRIYKAASFLSASENPVIAQAMYESGYEDQSNFNKAFSSRLGLSPRSFVSLSLEERSRRLLAYCKRFYIAQTVEEPADI